MARFFGKRARATVDALLPVVLFMLLLLGASWWFLPQRARVLLNLLVFAVAIVFSFYLILPSLVFYRYASLIRDAPPFRITLLIPSFTGVLYFVWYAVHYLMMQRDVSLQGFNYVFLSLFLVVHHGLLWLRPDVILHFSRPGDLDPVSVSSEKMKILRVVASSWGCSVAE